MSDRRTRGRLRLAGRNGDARTTVGVVVAAAGIGQRLGDQGPKALVPVAGRPLLAWVLDDLHAAVSAGPVVVVTHPAAVPAVEHLVAEGGYDKVTGVVTGGATRQRSVANGLAALSAPVSHVAVHDAARPLAGPGLLDELLAALLADPDGCDGIVPARPVTDTIREVTEDGRSAGLVDRERLRGMQTPQLFTWAALSAAHARAARDGVDATDDAALVERAGGSIRVALGPADNLKVTTPLDLAVAELLLTSRASVAHAAARHDRTVP